MAAEVAEFFADPAQNMKVYQTVDADHRRIETRARRVSQAVDWLFSDRRYKGGPRFPGLATIAGVTSTRQIGEVTTTATRLYLASAHLTPARFAAAVRAHWAIENSLHWLLDVTFDEDRARNRMDNGPENLAILRKLTLNLLRKARPKLPYPENENAQDAPMPSQEPSSAKCDSPGDAASVGLQDALAFLEVRSGRRATVIGKDPLGHAGWPARNQGRWARTSAHRPPP